MKKIQSEFEDFHRRHPEVYETLTRLTRKAKIAGKKRVGMKMLWEVLRWEMYLENREDEFKLNNNFTSRYARLIMDNNPDLVGMFEVRRLRRRAA